MSELMTDADCYTLSDGTKLTLEESAIMRSIITHARKLETIEADLKDWGVDGLVGYCITQLVRRGLVRIDACGDFVHDINSNLPYII